MNLPYYSNRNMCKDTDIAVIGMAGRFPGASNIDEYWCNLTNGTESIHFFSEEELLELGISEELLHNKAYVKAKGYLDDADCFDADFFGYTPKEATIMNPQTRLFLECVYSALDDAGYTNANTNIRIGLFAGASSYKTWRESIENHEYENISTKFNNELLIDKDFICANVAYKLGLRGPSYVINTACSTSLTTVHVACQSILNDECTIAVAGGSSVTLPFKNGYIYEEGMIHSPDGHCRAFDKNSKGTVTGNGVGVVVLKKFSEALKDKDNIYAVIKGSSANNDGNNKVSFTAPSYLGIEEVVRTAYERANINIEKLRYIEMHGTGTPLGDAVEIAALKSAFNEKNFGKCYIGSVKSNIGHLDAASGIASFIKAVLVLYHKKIPPAINYTTPNDELTEQNSIFEVNTCAKEIDEKEPIYAGVNSFGQGGTNVHVVLENFTDYASEDKSIVNSNLLLFSAKSKSSLHNYINSVYDYTKNNMDVNLSDIAYTLALTKKHYNHRAFVVKDKIDQMNIESDMISYAEVKEKYKVILICDGNSGVNEHLIRNLYNQFPSFANYMNGFMVIDENFDFACIEEFQKVLILTGMLSLLKDFNIHIDRFVARDIGMIALMNVFYGISFEEAFDFVYKENNNDSIDKNKYYIFNPERKDNKSILDFKTLTTCSYVKEIPDAINVSSSNKLYLYLNSLKVFCNTEITEEDVLIHEDKELYSFDNIIGSLWLYGCPLKMNHRFTNDNCKKVHIPSYSFDKMKYPLQPQFSNKIKKKMDLNFYTIDWMLELSPNVANDKKDKILIFTPSEYICHIKEYCDLHNCNLFIAETGKTFHKCNEYYYTFDPDEENHYDMLFHNLMEDKISFKYIINLMPLSSSISFEDLVNIELLNTELLNLNMFRVQCMLKGLLNNQFMNNNIIISNITQNLYNITPLEEANFSFSTLRGIQEVISKEYMNITCKNIDLSNHKYFDLYTIERIVNETSNKKSENIIVLDQNYRFIPTINKYNMEPTSMRLTENGIYIILGGIGKIGEKITDFIAQNVKCTIVLTGFNKIKSDELVDILEEKSKNHIDPELYNRLLELSSYGSKILFSKVNILDRDGLNNFISNVHKMFGHINGIINCVGITDKKYNQIIDNTKKMDLEAQLQIRQNGLINLDSILDNYDYDFCIHFSSIASLLGGIGQYAYAAACSFMDHYVSVRNKKKKKKWEVINIDTWITESEYRSDYSFIPRDIAFNMMKKIFQSKTRNEYVITFTDIDNYLNTNKALINAYQEDKVTIHKKEKKEILIEIWNEIFGRKVGLEEEFFLIGGNSLKALDVISSIRTKINVKLSIKDLYSLQTLGNLISLIEEKNEASTFTNEPIEIGDRQEYYPCSYSQKEMFIHKNNLYPSRFNLACVYLVDGLIDRYKLNEALNRVVRKHEIFKTRFIPYNGEYYQKIEENIEISVNHIYGEEINEIVKNMITSFDITTAPLIRMCLITEKVSGKVYLFTDMHHAIFDDQTIQMFFNELLAFYNDENIDNEVKKYKEYSYAQSISYKNGSYQQSQEFWKNKKNNYKYTELTPDIVSSDICYNKTESCLVNEDQYKVMTKLSSSKSMSVSSLIFSVWMLTISYLTSQEKVSIGLRVTNRLSEYKHTMGCFLEKVILMSNMNIHNKIEEYLDNFNMEYNMTLENSYYPFYLLNQDYNNDKLFSILFNYMIIEKSTFSKNGITLIPYKYDWRSLNSKYDFNFRIFDDKSRINCSLKYRSSSYSQDYIGRIFTIYRKIFKIILSKRELTIEQLFMELGGD